MKPDFDILDKIVETQGTNAKIDLLKQALLHEDTKNFLDILYNDDIYGIADKSIDKVIDVPNKLFVDDKTFPEQIEFMKTLRGNAKIDSLGDFFSKHSKSQRTWFKRALMKDFPKVGIKSFNKALRQLNLKEKEILMLQVCTSVILDTQQNVLSWNGLDVNGRNYLQFKYDGMRLYLKKVGNNMTGISRNNKEFLTIESLYEYMKRLFMTDDFIFDGEITATNGDFNTLAKKMRSNGTVSLNELVFNIFDVIRFNGKDFRNMPQKERHKWLMENIPSNEKTIKIAETYIVNSEQSIIEKFQEITGKGGEGIIIKPEDGLYEYDSRKYWYKMKPVFEATLKVVGVMKGNGKNRNKISALFVEDKYKSVETKVGSGLKEKDIDYLTEMGEEWIVGKFVDIYYNEILETGLRFPRFKEPNTDKEENLTIRDDKDEADDLIPLKVKIDELKEKQLEKEFGKRDKEVQKTIDW